MTKSHLEYALKYAKQGFYVFPLCVGSKIPLSGSNGLLDATIDEEIIKKWWEEEPMRNIGIRTGKISNIVVLDIDVKKANGFISLEEFPKLPETPCVKTPSGGKHYYFKYDERIKTTVNFRPGIDIRSDGAYVVAPPSVLI